MRKEVIGDCTLYLGDCRKADVEFSSLVSDPPFGMEFRSNFRDVKHKAIENDDTAELLQWACAQEAGSGYKETVAGSRY